MPDKASFRPTERFSGLADIYAAARPTYPADAIDFIVSHCKLSASSLLVDVGCGTGISSRLIANRGVEVIGLEPNADMRAKADSDEGSHERKPISYRSGTGESTGLDDASVDAILAAQAFHWFEPEPALKEFHRVLKSNGWAVLMWNERDESDSFSREYGAVITAQRDTKAVEMQRGRHAGEPLMNSALFTDACLNVFPNEQLMDQEGVVMRACSASYAPTAPTELAKMKEDLKRVYRRHTKDGHVSLKYETLVFSARRK